MYRSSFFAKIVTVLSDLGNHSLYVMKVFGSVSCACLEHDLVSMILNAVVDCNLIKTLTCQSSAEIATNKI